MSRIRRVFSNSSFGAAEVRPGGTDGLEPTLARKRVLFVCIGNLCRSPMAEAFARKYGSDCVEPLSAGLSPAVSQSAPTRTILLEKNVELGSHAPRSLYDFDLHNFDLLVNMSGQPLPGSLPVRVENWSVEDPFGGSDEDYRKTREAIEMLVMRLILRIRAGKFDSAPQGSSQ